MDLIELAERAERAKPYGNRELIRDLARSKGLRVARPDWSPDTWLDEARSFLPEGALWCVGSMEDGPFARVLWPSASGSYTGNYIETRASTPALALTAAALRARAAN